MVFPLEAKIRANCSGILLSHTTLQLVRGKRMIQRNWEAYLLWKGFPEATVD